MAVGAAIKHILTVAAALLTVLPILCILIICDRIWPDSGWLDDLDSDPCYNNPTHYNL